MAGLTRRQHRKAVLGVTKIGRKPSRRAIRKAYKKYKRS